MIQSLDELRHIFAGTTLANRATASVSVLDTPEKVLAIEISKNEIEAVWSLAYKNRLKTGRYPVVTSIFSSGASFKAKLLSEDVFSRHLFTEAIEQDDISPKGLISASKKLSGDDLIHKLIKRGSDWACSFDEVLDTHLFDTENRYGVAPSVEEIRKISKEYEDPWDELRLEHALFDWEQSQSGDGNPQGAIIDWFQQESCALLLMPNPNSSEQLAYINWYGTSEPGAQYYIALLRDWEERYGAHLVGHYGNMLQFAVERPPTNHNDAWKLAVQHDLAAPSTLGPVGITIRHHALALMQTTKWFLQENP